MRITQSMMTRNYLNGLNRSIRNVAQSNARMGSGRKFDKVWDDTAAATKAFTVRERLYKSEKFVDVIDSATGELSSAESNLMSMNKLLENVNDKLLQAVSGSTSAEAKETIANEIKNIKSQIMQLANSKFGEKFLFGSSNNSTGAFTEVGGKLHFNGIDVDTITKNADGNFVYPDPVTSLPVPVPESMDRFLDIGLGIVVTNNQVNQKTAFQINTPGLDALGFGVDGNGKSKNIFNILSELESAVRPPVNPAVADQRTADLKTQKDKLLMSITDIGSKTSFLDQMKDRFENDIFNLKAEQTRLETISLEEESIYNAEYNTAWMVALKMGSKLIPPSLFDFMN